MTEYVCEVIEPPVIGSYRKIALLEEVIRCRDCADCNEEGIYTPQYYCLSKHWNSGCSGTPTDPDGFCKWGKRK